jgi:hypothetical protein
LLVAIDDSDASDLERHAQTEEIAGTSRHQVRWSRP